MDEFKIYKKCIECGKEIKYLEEIGFYDFGICNCKSCNNKIKKIVGKYGIAPAGQKNYNTKRIMRDL